MSLASQISLLPLFQNFYFSTPHPHHHHHMKNHFSSFHLTFETFLRCCNPKNSREKSENSKTMSCYLCNHHFTSQHSFPTRKKCFFLLHFSLVLTFCPIWMINGLFSCHRSPLSITKADMAMANCLVSPEKCSIYRVKWKDCTRQTLKNDECV